MTTKKEKKSVKKTKVVKSGSPAGKIAKRTKAAGELSKVVGKKSGAGEIDKEKMAAFFSAGGLKEPVAAVKESKSEPGAVVVSESPASPAVPQPGTKVVETVVTSEVPVAKVADEEQDSVNQNLKDQNLEEKGENDMTTTEPVKSSSKNSSSTGILPIFVILIFMAAFWLYYISSAPLQRAAATQVEQGQAQILKLEKKVKSLQAVIAGLQAELKDLRSSSQPSQAATVKKAAAAKTVKDSSFDKAPIPFWRNYQHPRAKQLEKLNRNKKGTAVKTPAAGGDSFSKAPVPFWRKAKGVQSAAKVKDGTHHDSSFDKAPIPFWRK